MGLDLIAANVMQPLRLNVILKCVRENRNLSAGTWKQNNIKKIHRSRDDDRAGVV